MTTQEEVALRALVSRAVWDTDDRDDMVLIAGGGYADMDVRSIVAVWGRAVVGVAPTVIRWHEPDDAKTEDGEAVATVVYVEWPDA